jgi:hypothetical protein
MQVAGQTGSSSAHCRPHQHVSASTALQSETGTVAAPYKHTSYCSGCTPKVQPAQAAWWQMQMLLCGATTLPAIATTCCKQVSSAPASCRHMPCSMFAYPDADGHDERSQQVDATLC